MQRGVMWRGERPRPKKVGAGRRKLLTEGTALYTLGTESRGQRRPLPTQTPSPMTTLNLSACHSSHFPVGTPRSEMTLEHAVYTTGYNAATFDHGGKTYFVVPVLEYVSGPAPAEVFAEEATWAAKSCPAGATLVALGWKVAYVADADDAEAAINAAAESAAARAAQAA